MKKSATSTARWVPDRIIWQGTDDYWNVCILDDYTVYSSGGRLYCRIPSYIATPAGE